MRRELRNLFESAIRGEFLKFQFWLPKLCEGGLIRKIHNSADDERVGRGNYNSAAAVDAILGALYLQELLYRHKPRRNAAYVGIPITYSAIARLRIYVLQIAISPATP